MISIHAPTRGATSASPPHICQKNYFNPRSHEGSDENRLVQSPTYHFISIHAPTRGATTQRKVLTTREIISIHAPTRGATLLKWSIFTRRRISIHAPTRGATVKIFVVIVNVVISIHAPTRGATVTVCFWLSHLKGFQSTLPRGERHNRVLGSPPSKDFNPRSHEGSDEEQISLLDVDPLFQSTLPRGERPVWGLWERWLPEFQSTLPRGERPYSARYLLSGCIRFQSTLPRGERPGYGEHLINFLQFQSTLPRGERPPSRSPPQLIPPISIHAPTRGATAAGSRSKKLVD